MTLAWLADTWTWCPQKTSKVPFSNITSTCVSITRLAYLGPQPTPY